MPGRKAGTVKLTILYDNTVYRSSEGLQSRWGFSCLVERGERRMLFDTGGDGDVLLHNMTALNISPESIDIIVISHEHWDHAGGLPALFERNPDITIYRLERPLLKAGDTVIIEEPCRIADGVYSTGRLPGSPVDEQSLLLQGSDGWYVLAGCSHPGVAAILASAKQHGSIHGIIGGLHGFASYRLLESMSLICPTHCTQHIDAIRQRFPGQYMAGGVGRVIDLER